jgi:DNA polymerase-3 subunit alpha
MGFVHLHCHTEYSALDGLSTVKEILAAVKADGQTAVASTDHGNCAVHPQLQIEADKAGVKPIFGLEAYFVDDRFSREGKATDYWHLILWAMDNEGLRNLWAMSTESYQGDALWGKYPRLDWDVLRRLNKGVMASTACLGGSVANPYIHGDEERARTNLLQLHEIFGDRLYLEVQTTQEPDQLRVNRWLMKVGEEYGIEHIVACDSHYPTAEDKHHHKVWVAAATKREVGDDSGMFQGDHDYHIMTEAEAREALAYLPDAFVERGIANTLVVADRCTAKIEVSSRNPVFSRKTAEHPDPATHDIHRLLDKCLSRWDERTQGKEHSQAEYIARFENEFALVSEKGFSGYFLMVADIVTAAKDHGILVGPGRGSGAGSLVAYLLGITEIDPVKYDILFERFMTKGRTELPDFDLDFPSSAKSWVYNYAAKRWGGEDHVCTVGTHMRLRSKSSFKDISKAIAAQLPEDYFPDVQAIVDIVEAAEGDTAGLGLPWADLWARIEEPVTELGLVEKYPELFQLAAHFHGRLKTYGKHPAGIIIDPDNPLTENLPLRQGEDGQMIAQFDLKVLELLGYVKIDLLNISNLDTIQMTVDLIEKTTGKRVNPYAWLDELEDPYLYEQIGEGHCLGLFQIGSNIGIGMSRRMKPQNLRELADSITIVRPGPDRSGLKDLYLERRAGESEVSYPDPRMAVVLGNTWGCMIYQEQLMKLCMVIAGMDDVEADKVRKILGKKKVEEAKLMGADFIRRALATGTDEMVTRELWGQMEEFAKYSFGYAHALSYAILGVWTAWFKFHYPLQFLCAALSIADSNKIPAYVEEARRMGYKVLPPDINSSGRGFSLGDSGLDIRYGLDAIKGVGEAALTPILANQPFTSFEDFRERAVGVNSGVLKTLVRIGAFDSLEPNRRWLQKMLEHEDIPAAQQCQHRVEEERPVVWLPSPVKGAPVEPETTEWMLPCGYDWEGEPDEINDKTGRKIKRKAPAKKCTKSCRHWSPFEPPAAEDVLPYDDRQIRVIEKDMLGIYLSSTPFDVIPEEDLARLATAEDILAGPEGKTYMAAAIIQGFRTAKKRQDMGFLSLSTPRGSFSTVVFPAMYALHGDEFRVGRLVYVAVSKNHRGQALEVFEPTSIE